jgi:hypothetical protein
VIEKIYDLARQNKLASLLSLAIVGIGSYLLGRWLVTKTGPDNKTTEKTQDLAQKQITDTPSPSPVNGSSFQRTVDNLLNAYHTTESRWVMVPPKEEIQLEQPFILGWGSVIFKGSGKWKIHISIDPSQMEQAIPIIVDVLHRSNTPRLGFKMANKALLDSPHQIGKEFALIFDQDVEKAAIEGNPKAVEDCLSLLWKNLYTQGIRPEPGFVLIPETMDRIKNAPEGSQLLEKGNILAGKFDRKIPCPKDCNFFYYRNERFDPLCDDQTWAKGIPDVFFASEIIEMARTQPNIAHNPPQHPDPFLNLQIQEC